MEIFLLHLCLSAIKLVKQEKHRTRGKKEARVMQAKVLRWIDREAMHIQMPRDLTTDVIKTGSWFYGSLMAF